jgi:hypothetical protein
MILCNQQRNKFFCGHSLLDSSYSSLNRYLPPTLNNLGRVLLVNRRSWCFKTDLAVSHTEHSQQSYLIRIDLFGALQSSTKYLVPSFKPRYIFQKMLKGSNLGADKIFSFSAHVTFESKPVGC